VLAWIAALSLAVMRPGVAVAGLLEVRLAVLPLLEVRLAVLRLPRPRLALALARVALAIAGIGPPIRLAEVVHAQVRSA
jgi:hypothetical protein